MTHSPVVICLARTNQLFSNSLSLLLVHHSRTLFAQSQCWWSAALKALTGVVMELNDCAFPLLRGTVQVHQQLHFVTRFRQMIPNELLRVRTMHFSWELSPEAKVDLCWTLWVYQEWNEQICWRKTPRSLRFKERHSMTLQTLGKCFGCCWLSVV